MSAETQVSVGSGRPGPQGAHLGEFLKKHLREYAMLFSLVAIMIFFQIKTDGILLQPLNLTNLVLQNSYVVIMALGMLLVIVAGHIDLSVGSVAAFVGAIAAILLVGYQVDFLLTGLICLVVGGLIGAAQGYFVAYAKIPSFIVTLAGMLIFRGLTLLVLGGQNIGPFPTEFQRLSNGFVANFMFGAPMEIAGATINNTTALVLVVATTAVLIYFNLRGRWNQIKNGVEPEPALFFLLRNLILAGAMIFIGFQLASYKGLPNVLVIMSVLIALYTFVTTRTTVGRRIYALGGNEKAARLSGIDTNRLSFLTFVNMGALAALAGLVVTARLNSATPKAGVGFELDVIAACFIGGASASGGVGKITGAVIGAFIMGVMNNGMSILGIGIDWQQMIKGGVLLAAVYFDVYNKNKG